MMLSPCNSGFSIKKNVFFYGNRINTIDIYFSQVYILYPLSSSNAAKHGGVAKLVIASACQAEDRGVKPRRSRFMSPSSSD